MWLSVPEQPALLYLVWLVGLSAPDYPEPLYRAHELTDTNLWQSCLASRAYARLAAERWSGHQRGS